MQNENEYFKSNQALWNAKTGIHLDSEFYDLSSFMKGASTLNKIELDELPQLKGKKVLHAQCHFGMDTLSMQRMGALCTGVDFSSTAISKASELNAELGLAASFIESNIYDLDSNLDETFDVVFTSYGTICWLPDLDRWAHQLLSRLKPGGTFVMAEFHPVMHMYDWDKSDQVAYSYFNNGHPYMEETQGTYADRTADLRLKEYFWQHPISDVINSLIEAGMILSSMKEYDYSPYNLFKDTVERAAREYLYVVNGEKIPLVYSIKGIKK